MISRSAPVSSSSSVARSAAALRSSVNTVCLPASSAYQPDAARANGSPPGGSTLVTAAPNSASRAHAAGPGRLIARDTTFTPVRGSTSKTSSSRRYKRIV
ncbi:Uncharacterised protein [Mycobacteroides abscessus subsp. abscessus]|nr:Uncharacterised protein [Mycobacteroides abscessus subsp. abscessus]